ncbi:aminotransferase class V-fold PLP-dependent enzyme [Terrisporobacter mayombei]|uniref:cysteine desulfurase n=1 Tax=Terrisporobacter mayombei TaxID=1541 RepID=A0ABY9PYB7_9FIRM|nr:aminotransferase class V-fold PLP-dependent enzyme [Terrisporobacter mayombei]MCC3868108.1 aminotransferase class V-fold PLP-dependent enzyme [Terrisporobacter mayombei]WMT80248.1 Cysteine desulfurase SufS [Terrisporobacter mayombei]
MGIYLDNAATSFPKPKEVSEAVYDFMTNNGTSSGRGAYKKAMESDFIIYECRKLIGELFNFNNPKNVIFTSNVTESINMVLRGMLKENDHVITSSLEHNAVWRTLKTLEKEKNIDISKVKCDKHGITKANDVEKLIKENTKLIIFTAASNVIGTIQPIKEIGEIARKNKIPFVVDGAQLCGAYRVDVQNDNIDILTFTGHKSLLGPMGTGGIVINCDYNIEPTKSGGTGGDSAYEYQVDYYPNKLETGTLNVSGICGLRSAVKFLLKEKVENIYEKEKNLTEYALNILSKVNDVEIYGPKDSEKITPVISFNIKNKRAEEVAHILGDKYNIMVRAGLHCAPCAHEIIGTKEVGTVRVSMGYFNEKQEIDKLAYALNNL